MHYFTIYSSSRLKKWCQMLEIIFCLLQCSRNIRCPARGEFRQLSTIYIFFNQFSNKSQFGSQIHKMCVPKVYQQSLYIAYSMIWLNFMGWKLLFSPGPIVYQTPCILHVIKVTSLLFNESKRGSWGMFSWWTLYTSRKRWKAESK